PHTWPKRDCGDSKPPRRGVARRPLGLRFEPPRRGPTGRRGGGFSHCGKWLRGGGACWSAGAGGSIRGMSETGGQTAGRKKLYAGRFRAGNQAAKGMGRKGKRLSPEQGDELKAMERVVVTKRSQDETQQQRWLRDWLRWDKKSFWRHFARLKWRAS